MSHDLCETSLPFFFFNLLNRLREILETSWGISRPQQNFHAHPSSGQLHPSSPAAVAAFTALREDKLMTQAGKLGLTHAEKLSSVKGIWCFNLFLQTSHCPYQKLIATVLRALSTQTISTPSQRCITIKVPNHQFRFFPDPFRQFALKTRTCSE